MALIATLGIAATAVAAPARALSQSEILGTWRIISYVHEDAAGELSHPMGEHPTGYLVVGRDKRCTLVVAAEGRKPAQDEEGYAALAKTMLSYSAPFSEEAAGNELKLTLRPDVAWNPTMIEADIVRFVSRQGETLVVRSAPSPHGSVTAKFIRAH